MDRSGKSGHISPAIVEKYLVGMHYPAEKKKLLDNAQNKDAPNDVLTLIKKTARQNLRFTHRHNQGNGQDEVSSKR